MAIIEWIPNFLSIEIKESKEFVLIHRFDGSLSQIGVHNWRKFTIKNIFF